MKSQTSLVARNCRLLRGRSPGTINKLTSVSNAVLFNIEASLRNEVEAREGIDTLLEFS